MMNIDTESKSSVFDSVKSYLASIGLAFRSIDDSRPWGGFFTFEENLAEAFIMHFYSGTEIHLKTFRKVPP